MSHLPLFASSSIFPLTSQTPTTLSEHDEHLGPDERSHCDDLRHADSHSYTQNINQHFKKKTFKNRNFDKLFNKNFKEVLFGAELLKRTLNKELYKEEELFLQRRTFFSRKKDFFLQRRTLFYED